MSCTAAMDLSPASWRLEDVGCGRIVEDRPPQIMNEAHDLPIEVHGLMIYGTPV